LEELINSILKDLEKSTDKIQIDLYREIQLALRELTLDAAGNIKPTIANIKVVKKIVKKLEPIILRNPQYKNSVKDVYKSFNEITALQDKLTKDAFGSANLPSSLTDIKELAREQTLYDLTETGVKSNVIEKIETVLIDNVKSGNSFNTMNEQLIGLLDNTKTKNGGKLLSYSKQIATDGMYQYAGNYDKLVSQAYKTQWYKYVGSEIDTTRPLCHELVNKKYIHESELTGIADGRVDGKQVSVAGQVPGTTGSNFIVFRGGYNCRHRMIPVPEATVPKELREKFKQKQ
jgi:hypothetical protein